MLKNYHTYNIFNIWLNFKRAETQVGTLISLLWGMCHFYLDIVQNVHINFEGFQT